MCSSVSDFHPRDQGAGWLPDRGRAAPPGCQRTRVELKRIQRELGKTLVYVTHDQEEAMSVADRMAILEKGRIRQTGAPVDIYDHPASVYVARLLGSPAMNILPSAHEGTDLAAAEGAIHLPARIAPQRTAEIGVRPEDLKVEPWTTASGGKSATVAEVEPLGGYTVVTLDAGQTRLRALMRGQPKIEPQAEVALACDPDAVHFFSTSGRSAGAMSDASRKATGGCNGG